MLSVWDTGCVLNQGLYPTMYEDLVPLYYGELDVWGGL